MKIPAFLRNNLLLKMTSLNAGAIVVRLFISAIIQRLLTEYVGPVGQYKIGQLRSISQLLVSVTSLGTFNGVVKYIAEYKTDEIKLQKLFSSVFVFLVVGVSITVPVLLIFSDEISLHLFASTEYSFVIKLLAVVVPFIAIQRVFNGVINGLSEYKKFVKIDIISYLAGSVLTVVFLFQYNLNGVLVAIAITPIVQVLVLLSVFYRVLREYLQFKKLQFRAPMAKALLAFTVMSFVSSILLPLVEIDIRSMLDEKLSGRDAGIWTNMTFISHNYMVFSGSIFTLYVIPKFAGIYDSHNFKKEVISIYKTLLPLFAVGMVLVYLFRNVIIDLIYPGQYEMASLFKWQLMGDFVRLASLVLAHQFLAKKLVINFVVTEIMSLALFYGFAYYFVGIYGIEGVVMAHLLRYIIYFLVVLFLIIRYFKKQERRASLGGRN
ncbi:O-antigen translocase [Aequorivita sp. H23M31]|uniref:O-antigen translocase n=1 Tax=Aequorivita ciconiae TaxID=2494375 RepID=A0A410G6I8_9FLAO|nr:O-antigen translocase [Aequorivita sp. H23M31]QAA82908.1 O-antigen translocase [Aequorivita sp. H23M31]